MKERSIRDRTALVTGASSGLGADFARDLAARGCRVILVARREDLLRTLQQELAGNHGVEVSVIAMDLSAPDAPQVLHDRIAAEGKQVDILVNNAGFGLYGPFQDISWERERNMLELDIITLVHLTKVFAKEMIARKFGAILQVASIGAFQPSPLYASYSAAKSFVLSFGEAIDYELRGSGVTCTVISPGVTATEFLKVSGQQATRYQRLTMMKSADVARIGVEAMLHGRRSVVPGTFNLVASWASRFLPRPITLRLAHRSMA